MQKAAAFKARVIPGIAPYRSFTILRNPQYLDPNYSKVVIVGGGFSGQVITAHLPRLTTIRKFEMKMFDSKAYTTYLPSYDLIPFEIKTREEIQKPILTVLNDTTGMEFSPVESIDPEKKILVTEENKYYAYDYLVLAGGLVPNYSKVNGLKEALEDRETPVITTATLEDMEKCKREIELFYSGKVLFYNDKKARTYTSAVNSALLFDDHLRQRKGGGNRSNSEISVITNDNTLLPYPKYAVKAKNFLFQKQINFDYPPLELVEVDKHARKAIFVDLNTKEKVEKEFDLLFVNPEFQLPNILSGLADKEGYLDIDHQTLVHKQYSNIFALGHCARTPGLVTSYQSVIEQSLTAAANLELTLQAATNHTKPDKLVKYNGQTTIPYFVGNKKCFVGEINSAVPETDKGPTTMDFVKQAYLNQKVYFGLLTQGVWFGDTGFRVPKFQL